MIKFNVFTGNLDLINRSSESAGPGSSNFSYKVIKSTESISVPENQQMLFSGDILVNGDLLVSGEIKEVTQYDNQSFFYTTILENENVEIGLNRLLLYKENLMVLGNLMVSGTLGVV